MRGVLASVMCHSPGPDWQVLAELAHDLRTPLQSLKLLCAILDHFPQMDPQVRQTHESLHAAADRAVQIAQELLELCRGPAQGRRSEGAKWFGLGPFLAALAREHAVAAQRKGLELAQEFTAAQEWEVFADQLRLSRLLSNLLVNAIRYTSSGRVVFHASWREQSAERFLVLGVADTGPGLSREEQDSIFQPFERGQAGKEGDSGGSGLGLAVVDRLKQELGLTLEVYSEYGRGSDFQLLLPAARLRPRHETEYSGG
jgi:signal transduction histidine kinase